MNKAELIHNTAAALIVSKSEVTAAVDQFLAELTEAVARGDEVSIPGLGKFVRAETPARTGRNPATGESIEIPAGRKPKFSAAKGFKDMVANYKAPKPLK